MIKPRFLTRFLFLAIIVTVAAALPIQAVSAEQSGTFTGVWTASGQRELFDFAEGREVGTFRVAGHVNLKTEIGEVEDYWAECIGLRDTVSGSTGRCVWRSHKSDKAYSVLRGEPFQEGVKVTGEFVGGTGSLKGLEGSFTFTWSSTFTDQDSGKFTGHTQDLSGSYRIP